jgi:Na+/melibiose symporter-like transporter
VPVRVLHDHRDLRLLLSGQLISSSGDYVLGVGLAYSVYDLTGSTLASAMSLLAAFVPQVVIGPLAGVLVDRWDRLRTMVWANVGMAVGLVPLLLVTDETWVWLIYAVLALQSVGEVFFAPAQQAMIPRLVGEGEIATAIALNSQAGQLARLGGSALGGVAAAAGGVPAVAVVDALTFIAAAFLLSRIRTAGAVSTAAQTVDAVVGKLRGFGHSLTEGVRAVRQSRGLRAVLLFALITSFGEGIMGTLFAPFVLDVLDGGAQAFGAVTSAQAVGGILGALVATAVVHRFSAVHLLGGAAIVFGVIDLAIFLYPVLYDALWPALVGMALVGLPGALLVTGYLTVFQQSSTDAVRGRVFSLLSLTEVIALVAGALTAGLLGNRLGIVPVLAWQGAGYVVAGGLVLLLLRGFRPPSEPVAQPKGSEEGLAHAQLTQDEGVADAEQATLEHPAHRAGPTP